MKLMALFLVLLMSFTIFCPVLAAPDGEILPEVAVAKKNDVPARSMVEEPAWGVTIVALILGGFLFLFLEIAIIPGFGAAGIIGLLMLGSGLVLAYMKLTTSMAVAATFAAGVGLVLLIVWFFYYFPHTSIGKKFVLETESSVEDGCIGVQDLRKFVGKEGVTTTMLRPSGIALVEGERLDVISDCEFVEKGTPIKIVKESGGRLVIAVIESDEK